MKWDKYKKSVDNIKPSQQLVESTIKKIKQMKQDTKQFKKYWFLNCKMGYALALSFVLVIAFTYGLTTDSGLLNNSNSSIFLDKDEKDYSLFELTNIDKILENDFKNMYVEDVNIEDIYNKPNYTILYSDYIKFVDLLRGYNYNEINTIISIENIHDYKKVVINQSYDVYLSDNNIIVYDYEKQIYYSVLVDNNINMLYSFIDNMGKVGISLMNFNETSFQSLYAVASRDESGNWIQFGRSEIYNDYLNLVSIFDSYNGNLKKYDNIDLNHYKDHYVIEVDRHYYIYVPSNIDGNILVFDKGLDKVTYYVYELNNSDETMLNELIEYITNVGTRYDISSDYIEGDIKNGYNALGQVIEKYQSKTSTNYSFCGLTKDNKLIIKFYAEAFQGKLDTSLFEMDKEIIVAENVKSYLTILYGSFDYPLIIYITDDNSIYYIDVEEVITNGDINIKHKISIIGDFIELEKGQDENGYVFPQVITKTGEKIKINITK